MAKKKFKLAVEFGGVSIGDKTARIGIKVSREGITLEAADEAFCDRRLTGKLVLGKGDDAQGKIVDDLEHECAGSFDIKGYRVSSTSITAALTFSKKEIKLDEVALFAKGTGMLVVDNVGEIPEEEKGTDEHEEDEDDDEDDDEGSAEASENGNGAPKRGRRLAKAK